jgi:2-polyprenyl-3-methyl-5-hydroxy-6-metoxy-1,4-benzoquinol methylase
VSSRYTAEIDLANPNDTHTMAIARVPARSDVLDVGAADGSVARVLRATGCRVWGVELDEEAAVAARQVCEEVVVGDVETIDLQASLGRRFDVILLLDVLEHLKDPAAVLSQARDLLADDGWILVSLPNVAHAAVRLQLLGGRFVYTDLGLLDRTHLRFFDRQGVEALFAGAGMAVIDLARVTRPVTGTEIPVDGDDPLVVERLRFDPEAETYQFVVMAVPEGSRLIDDPPVLPARDLQDRVRELHAELKTARIGRNTWLHARLDELALRSAEQRHILQTLLVELRKETEEAAASLKDR